MAVVACLALSPEVQATEPGAQPAAQLVMLEEDACPWCEKWNEEIGVVYAKTAEGRRAPLRRLNIHRPMPKDLAFLKPGNFTPTFILVSQGREIGRIRGHPGEDFFWGFLNQLIERMNSDKNPTSLTVN